MKKLVLVYCYILYSLNLSAQLDKSSIEVQFTPSIGASTSVDVGDNINIIKKTFVKYKREVYCEEAILYSKKGKVKSLEVSKDFVFVGVTPKLNSELDKYCNAFLCICTDPQTNQIIAIEEATSIWTQNNSKYPIVSEKPIFLKARVVSQTPIIETADFHKEFIQEFIYNGKVGNIVKFSYREFYDNLARPAFTQDIQYDLAEGNIIGFKGAKFEIVNASNFKLDYKILSPFKLLESK